MFDAFNSISYEADDGLVFATRRERDEHNANLTSAVDDSIGHIIELLRVEHVMKGLTFGTAHYLHASDYAEDMRTLIGNVGARVETGVVSWEVLVRLGMHRARTRPMLGCPVPQNTATRPLGAAA